MGAAGCAAPLSRERGKKPLGAWALLWETFVDLNFGVSQGQAGAGTDRASNWAGALLWQGKRCEGLESTG